MTKAASEFMQPWARGKLLIVGEGRAGKTALCRSITGQVFEETKSTVGIEAVTKDVAYSAVNEWGEWSEYKRPEREVEAAIARNIASNMKKKKEGENDKKHEKKDTNERINSDKKGIFLCIELIM